MKKATPAQKRATATARAAKRAKKDAKNAKKARADARAAHAREVKAKRAKERSSQPRPGSVEQKVQDGNRLMKEASQTTDSKEKARYQGLWFKNTDDMLRTPLNAPDAPDEE